MVHGHDATEGNMVVNVHVTTQHATIGHGHMVTNVTIMSDVSTGHQVVVIAYIG